MAGIVGKTGYYNELFSGLFGSTDCDLEEKDYRLDRSGNGFDSREDGSDCGLHLLFVEEDLLCIKVNPL